MLEWTLSVACPFCKAAEGQLCVTRTKGESINAAHWQRVHEAAKPKGKPIKRRPLSPEAQKMLDAGMADAIAGRIGPLDLGKLDG